MLLTALAFGQSTATMYTTDLSGHVVASGTQQTAAGGGRTEISQTINGRKVALQQTETRVLSDGPNGRTTETITKKYDPSGQTVGIEKIVSVEQKSGNKTTVQATISRSDLQGQLIESERRTVETMIQGGTTTANVDIVRPGLNGTFVSAEKRSVVTVAQNGKTQETETVLRPTLSSGPFTETARTVKETQKVGDKTVETKTVYDLGYTGKMELAKQQRSTSVKTPNGTENTVVDIYGVNSDGVARDEQRGPKLIEQQLIVRTPGAGGTVTESTSVRRPTLADQSKLGESVQISETVCSGKCDVPLPNLR